MVKHFFNAVFKFGTSEAQNELILAGENMVKNYKDSRAWEKLLVDTGDFFIKTEKEKNTFLKNWRVHYRKKICLRLQKN